MSTRGTPARPAPTQQETVQPAVKTMRIGAGQKPRRRWLEVVAIAALIALIGTGAAVASSNAHPNGAVESPTGPAAELKLGYFGNITHGPALAGVEQGTFAENLGETTLQTQVFTTGPAAVEALNAGAIDAAYRGPNPALNSFVQSGGDVTINPTTNAQTLRLFQDGKIDGAWVAEPWASRLVLQAGAKVLVNEADLWDGGVFSTTVLAVNKGVLEKHPQTVEALLTGHVASVQWLNDNPDKSGAGINQALVKAIGEPLEDPVIARALTELEFTADSLAGTFPTLLDHGVSVGVSKPAELDGLFDLTLLNKVLKAAGEQPVTAAGLGTQ
ncbi:ABC transporter substrate-binding protein [Arthrobacter sp. TMN-49]